MTALRTISDFRPSYLLHADQVQRRVADVLASGFVLQGRWVAHCEDLLKELCGARHAVVTSSATSAIDAVVTALPGPIRTPTINFVSLPHVARAHGHAVTLAARTRPLGGAMRGRADAGVRQWHVALAGHAGRDYVSSVGPDDIEDASQCLLTDTSEGMVGTLGRAGVYSFTFNKVFTAGEGGAVVTDDDELADEVRRYRDFGRLPGQTRAQVVQVPGVNARMSELHAALLSVQLENARAIQSLLRDLHTDYATRLRAHGVPVVVDDYDNYSRLIVCVPDVPGVRAELAAHGVATPTPVMDFSLARPGHADEAESGWDQLLCLPFWFGLTADDIDYVARMTAGALNRSGETPCMS